MKLMATLGDGQDTQEKYRFKLDKKKHYLIIHF